MGGEERAGVVGSAEYGLRGIGEGDKIGLLYLLVGKTIKREKRGGIPPIGKN
jgi:hypothetical protein